MPTECNPTLFEFSPVDGRQVVAAFDGGAITSDAGAMLLGETDVTGRISKIGDASVRTALYEAANVILTRPVRGSLLKSWAMRVAKRTGMRKAKVALARKLAVILHRMLANGSAFVAGKAAAKA